MNKLLKIVFILALVMPVLGYGYSTGPPDGRTGAPGENTCATSGCHNSFALDSGDGTLQFTAFPETYDPGETYTVEVSLEDPGQSRWGFELVALDADGNQAGSIDVTDSDNTQTSTSDGKTYIKHTSTGTQHGTSDGPVTWTFDWTAPDSGSGIISFYVAGNAANGNGNNQGDFIYTHNRSSNEASTAIDREVAAAPRDVKLLSAYPNPFNPSTTIGLKLSTATDVRLTIYNIRGEAIKSLANEYLEAGRHSYRWDGTTDNGEQVSSGVYIYRMESRSHTKSKKLMFIR